MVLGELQEARGNVESLRRQVKEWSAKLAECRRRGDITGGGHAGERVLKGNRRVREAQKAVEVLERELQGMGGEVQVKQEGGVNDDDIVELGEVVVDEKDEERRANPGVKREEEEGGGSKHFVLATFQTNTKKLLKTLLNVAGTAYWNVAGTLILAILHVGGGHPGQPFGPARRSGDPLLAKKRSPAHLFGYVASAVALAARRCARVPHGLDGLHGSPRQRSRDAHRGVGQHP